MHKTTKAKVSLNSKDFAINTLEYQGLASNFISTDTYIVATSSTCADPSKDGRWRKDHQPVTLGNLLEHDQFHRGRGRFRPSRRLQLASTSSVQLPVYSIKYKSWHETDGCYLLCYVCLALVAGRRRWALSALPCASDHWSFFSSDIPGT